VSHLSISQPLFLITLHHHWNHVLHLNLIDEERREHLDPATGDLDYPETVADVIIGTTAGVHYAAEAEGDSLS
jgi:hypothetical protein